MHYTLHACIIHVSALGIHPPGSAHGAEQHAHSSRSKCELCTIDMLRSYFININTVKLRIVLKKKLSTDILHSYIASI